MAIKLIHKLQHLTQDLPSISHAEQTLAALEGGVRWIQLRVKDKNDDEWEEIAREVKEITTRYNSTLIINDSPHLAKSIGATGVHLGTSDMSIAEARAILGDEFIIGATAHNEKELQEALKSGADYIGIGPYRFTNTKKDLSPILSPLNLSHLLGIQNKVPIVVIGGIRIEDLDDIINAGAYGVAVSSAINLAVNPQVAAARFVEFYKNNLDE